jgi:hypothetical protein
VVLIGLDPHKASHTAVAVDDDEHELARLQGPTDASASGCCRRTVPSVWLTLSTLWLVKFVQGLRPVALGIVIARSDGPDGDPGRALEAVGSLAERVRGRPQADGAGRASSRCGPKRQRPAPSERNRTPSSY